MPYVYQDAKREAVMPVRSEKTGTAAAKTKARAVAAKQRIVQTVHPSTVWVYRWRERRKRRTNTSFAAACEYRAPDLLWYGMGPFERRRGATKTHSRKFTRPMANVTLAHTGESDRRAGDCTVLPRYT